VDGVYEMRGCNHRVEAQIQILHQGPKPLGVATSPFADSLLAVRVEQEFRLREFIAHEGRLRLYKGSLWQLWGIVAALIRSVCGRTEVLQGADWGEVFWKEENPPGEMGFFCFVPQTGGWPA
jgi:hypothetical protein